MPVRTMYQLSPFIAFEGFPLQTLLLSAGILFLIAPL